MIIFPGITTDSFIRLCPILNLKMIHYSQTRNNPIQSDSFLDRFQLDLVDMRQNLSKFSSNVQYLAKI